MDFPDTADMHKCVAQRIDGHIAPIERVVSGVYTKGNRMGVGEREGTLHPTDAHKRDARPQSLAPQGYLAPVMADMTDRNPMWGANGAIPSESSGRVKVAVEGTNAWSIVTIKQRHIAHNFGENFDGQESDWVWGNRQSVEKRW